MSRRHKETDIENTQPQMTESAADCRQESTAKPKVIIGTGIIGKKVKRTQPSFIIGSISKEHLQDLIYKTLNNAVNETFSSYLDFFDDTIRDDYSLVFPEDRLEDDKPRRRGRPVVEQLCSMFQDDAIWPMVKTVFHRIYKKSIKQATNLVQYLVCYMCALFRIDDTEEHYGRVAHFYRLMKGHLSKSVMPKLRTLQTGVKWLTDKTRLCFRCAKEDAEEAKHKAWERLEEIICGHMVDLAPQYM